MNCLTLEQLARLALDLDADDDSRTHTDECPMCGGRLAGMQALGDRLSRAHERFEQDHEQERAELMAALAAEDRVAKSAPAGGRLMGSWIGGLTTGQKTALGGLGVAAILAAVVLWAPNAPKRASAMERMAENIRAAKSWQATMDVEKARFDGHGKPAPPSKQTVKFYWRAPGSVRMDVELAGRKGTEIYHKDKLGINIDDSNKKFRLMPARQGDIPQLMMLDRLGQFSGQANRELGVKGIDGQSARGFGVDINRIDPDVPSGQAEIWIDTQTDLPVLLRYEIQEGGEPGALTFRDFHWNVELDPKLFDATPPKGYTNATPEATPLEQQVREIIEALAVYAELAGKYPQAKVVYGDVTRDEMYRMIGIKGGRPSDEQNRSDEYGKVLKAMKGFAVLNVIVFRENPDGAYYGLTVGPKDAEKVLLRWKLDDGRYQVIYGDLRAETVTAKRLRALEDQK